MERIRTGRTFGTWLDSLRRVWRRDKDEIRTERSFDLKGKLSMQQQEALFALRQSAGYSTLLDVIEMACIEQETRLINVDVTEPERIIAEHRMAKAFWQIFVALQKKVEYECNEYVGLSDKEEHHDADLDEVDEITGL